MLDDTNFISQKDPQNLLSAIATSPNQLLHNFALTNAAAPKKPIQQVVIAGMGGLAAAAEYLKVWPGLDVPFVICRNYQLPRFVGEHTLVIAVGYSGNTEETLSAMAEAESLGAQLVVMAHGGQMQALASAKQLPFVAVPEPSGGQVRVNTLLAFKAFVTVLEHYKLVSQGKVTELATLGHKLQDVAEVWLPEVPTVHNAAKQLAEEVMGKVPIMYAGVLFGAAYKWKISFNENAKNLAWCNQLPEFNHNEFTGWTSHPIEKPFTVINLLSTFDHPRVQQRFVVTEKLLSGNRPESIDIQVPGETLAEQLVWADVFGGMISTYVAVLNGVNPTPVALVEKFKKELA